MTMRDGGHNFVTVEAVKVAYRQTREGTVISFAVNPLHMPPEIALAGIGTKVMLAVAELTDQTPDEFKAEPERVPVPPPDPELQRGPAKSEKARQHYVDMDPMARARTRAVMMCGEKKFHEWTGAADEESAARWLRLKLRINSRSEIGTDERAFLAFKKLEDAYQIESKYGENLR